MLEIIYDAYLGELFGVALFSTFFNTSSVASERDKWQYLVALERHVAVLLKNWLEKNGQACVLVDAEMDSKGRQVATDWQDLEWQPLMDTLGPWIEKYAIKYRKIAEEASPEQYKVCNMIAKHEEAIFSFMQAERVGDKDSLKAVREFMTNFPNNNTAADLN